MELITSHWHQIIFIISLIVVAVKLNAQVKEIQKDLDNIEKRDTYVETVKLRAEVDQQKSQVSALWDYTNKLREKFNGH
jgi:uncharacterized protein YoxC